MGPQFSIKQFLPIFNVLTGTHDDRVSINQSVLPHLEQFLWGFDVSMPH